MEAQRLSIEALPRFICKENEAWRAGIPRHSAWMILGEGHRVQPEGIQVHALHFEDLQRGLALEFGSEIWPLGLETAMERLISPRRHVP